MRLPCIATEFSRKLPQDIQRKAAMQLISIHFSRNLNDLRKTPANRLERLKDALNIRRF
jgi:plasmid maintenance system killer protein